MLSRRLVLPWPLSPTKTLNRVVGESSSGARLRTLVSRSAWTSTDRSDAHRHDHAAVLLAGDRAEQARVELALELERDLVGGHGAQEVDHVAGVEADGHRASLDLGIELLASLADV